MRLILFLDGKVIEVEMPLKLWSNFGGPVMHDLNLLKCQLLHRRGLVGCLSG